jgi:Zn-finger nucleic acid-binding protein
MAKKVDKCPTCGGVINHMGDCMCTLKRKREGQE